MNLQRRRALSEAQDAIDTINQLLPGIRATLASVLADEKAYEDNIPEPLKGSRKAAEAARVVRELEAANAGVLHVDLTAVSQCISAALEDRAEGVATFGAEREGISLSPLRSAARHALEALGSRSKKDRERAAKELAAVLQ